MAHTRESLKIINELVERIFNIEKDFQFPSRRGLPAMVTETEPLEDWEELFESLEEAFLEALDTRKAELRHQANCLSAATRKLPTEILSIIVQTSLQKVAHDSYYDRLYDLMTVSKQWNAIIRSTPDFWFVIPRLLQEESYDNDLIQTVLGRCKNTPLAIERHELGYQDVYDEALCALIPQWESAYIITAPTLPSPSGEWAWRTTPAPLLREFTLSMIPEFVRGAAVQAAAAQADIFGGDAPQLQKLALRAFPIRWASSVFNRLKVLNLSDCSAGNGRPSFASLLDVLGRCAATLEELWLDSFWYSEEDVAGVPQRVMELPNLRKITLKGVGIAATRAVLRSMPEVPIRKLDIVAPSELWLGDDDLPLDDTTPQFLEFAQTLTTYDADQVYVMVGHREEGSGFWLSVTSSDISEVLTLDLDYVRPCRLFEWYATRIGLLNCKGFVDVRVKDIDSFDLPRFLDVLRDFTAFMELTLLDLQSHVLTRILQELTHPYEAGNKLKWCCPNMKMLNIVAKDGYDFPYTALEELVEGRYQESQGIPTKPGFVVEPPLRLSELTIRSSSNATMRRSRTAVEEILGKKAVEWMEPKKGERRIFGERDDSTKRSRAREEWELGGSDSDEYDWDE